LLQCAWSVLFATEIIIGSLVAILGILLALALLVRNIQANRLDASWQWAVFKFPFQIHCGWLWAASVVNANVLLVSLELDSAMLVMAAWISLGLWALVAAHYLLVPKNYVVPMVVAWASYAVRVELQAPLGSIAATFDQETISNLSWIAMVLAFAVLGATVIIGAFHFYQQHRGQRAPSSSRDTSPSEIPYGSMNN